MENKAKIGFLILLIFYIILAESEMWGPVIITGDTPAEAILKLSNTPAAVSAESVLVKRYDSTVSNYPINNIKTTKIQWDSVTSKPTAYNPVLHQHDSIYYRETEVNNLLSSKSDTSHTHPQYKINGLVDTITNHRNAIASKFATADTNKLAQKSHIHVISNVTGLQAALDSKQSTISAGTTGQFYAWDKTMKAVDWTYVANKPSSFTPSAHTHPWSGITDKPSTFPPATHTHSGYEPAITGTGNRVLSIQADGTGVKTGSIGDDGNVVHFEKAFIGNSLSTGIRHYHDVFLYSNPNSTETGILKIVMPQGWTNTFQRITIKGYNYAGNQGAWECIIGGYNYNATNDANDAWVSYSAEIRGSAPFSIVKLGYDGSKCVILLGTTETVWRYAKVAISDMLVGSAIYNWETGWSASIITSETGLTKLVTPSVNRGVSADWNALINKPSTFTPSAHTHPWSGITDKPTGTTNYITMFTNGATGAIGNSQLSQNTDGVIASKGITANDFLQSMGPLYTRSHIYLINKAGNAWLNFVTRDVSGSEAVVDLSNVRNIIPAGSALGVGGNILVISPSTNNTMELYVDSSRSAAGINAKTGLLEIRNTSTATNGDILIQSVTSDINISSQGESGEISLDAKRVKISRRNLKSQTFTYTVSGSYIIDLNNYYDVNLFIINSTATWVSIGFKNATVGDEIHVNIKGYGAIAYQRDPNSENAWYEWPGDPIKLDEFFYKLICTGTDNYYGQTINTWIIGS